MLRIRKKARAKKTPADPRVQQRMCRARALWMRNIAGRGADRVPARLAAAGFDLLWALSEQDIFSALKVLKKMPDGPRRLILESLTKANALVSALLMAERCGESSVLGLIGIKTRVVLRRRNFKAKKGVTK